MNEEDSIKILNSFLSLENKWKNRFNKGTVPGAIEKALQLLEQKDNKINKVKDKMIADKMEQFDDYVIYLIESYLKILEE